ncbi:MAG: hypothetical protein DMG97_40025, partial [Acidobacteria bacterium]
SASLFVDGPGSLLFLHAQVTFGCPGLACDHDSATAKPPRLHYFLASVAPSFPNVRHCQSRIPFARVFHSGYFLPIPKRGRKEQVIPMTQNSRRQKVMIAVVLSLFVLMMQAGLMAQNLGTAPQVNVAVQGQQGTQPEGTFLNLINWIGNVIAPVGAGGAALMAIGSFAMGRGFGKWVFTAIGLLMVSGVTRLLEFWIAQGTGGVT